MEDFGIEDRMNSLPAIELLESTHQFPCPYVFKVIGLREKAFVARTVAAVRAELPPEIELALQFRETPGGRHIAITLQPTVPTARQVLAIYRRLQTLSGLVMLW